MLLLNTKPLVYSSKKWLEWGSRDISTSHSVPPNCSHTFSLDTFKDQRPRSKAEHLNHDLRRRPGAVYKAPQVIIISINCFYYQGSRLSLF